MPKKIVKMWKANDYLWLDGHRAVNEGAQEHPPKRVFVVAEEDQSLSEDGYPENQFQGWVFTDKEEAEECADEENWKPYSYQTEAYYFKKFHHDIDIETPDGLLTVTESRPLSVEQFNEWCKEYIRADQKRSGNGSDMERAFAYARSPQKPIVAERVARAVFAAFEEHGRDEAFRMHLTDPMRWENATAPLKGLDAVLFAKLIYVGYEIEGEDETC